MVLVTLPQPEALVVKVLGERVVAVVVVAVVALLLQANSTTKTIIVSRTRTTRRFMMTAPSPAVVVAVVAAPTTLPSSFYGLRAADWGLPHASKTHGLTRALPPLHANKG